MIVSVIEVAVQAIIEVKVITMIEPGRTPCCSGFGTSRSPSRRVHFAGALHSLTLIPNYRFDHGLGSLDCFRSRETGFAPRGVVLKTGIHSVERVVGPSVSTEIRSVIVEVFVKVVPVLADNPNVTRQGS